MNEGQKRYAYEQWMLARVRRGEKFGPGGVPQGPHERNVPESINNDSVSGSPDQQPQADNDPQPDNEEEVDAAIDEFLEQISSRQDMGETEMDIPSTSGVGAKRPAPADSTTTKAAKVSKSGTSLPGTGGNLDGMNKGRGQPTEGGPIAILKPIGLHVDTMRKVYHKKWRFLTSANANVILAEGANATNKTPARYALTTGMASIPWEYAFFYMTPAEYNRMKDYPGTFAKSCHVKIRTWNTRVAFQTGDTQTSNATLNQNKFLQIAKGFRSIPHIASSNRRYTYSSTEPMQPTGFKAQTSEQYREGLKIAMYGYDNNSPNFVKAPPSDATGAEIYLQDYLTIYTLNSTNTNNPNPGFPPVKNFIEEYDASAIINSDILSMSYDFDYAPMTPQAPIIPNNLVTYTGQTLVATGTKYEVQGSKQQDSSHTSAPQNAFNLNRKYLQDPDKNVSYFTQEQNYYKCPMEQNGVFEEVNRYTNADSQQPSINIGIRAVPKLTTLDETTQAMSWLDAQGYFEVEATLVTESHDPYAYIKEKCYGSNTSTQLQWFTTDTVPKAVYHNYDLPNEYGRMIIQATS